MRFPVLLAVLSLAALACRPEDVSVYAPPLGRSGSVAAACKATPAPLAHLAGIVQGLAADDYDLYAFTSARADRSAPESLWRVPKDGSSPQRLVSSPTPMVGVLFYGVPYAEVTAVWTTDGPSGADGGPTGAVWSLDLTGSAAPVVLASGRRSPRRLAVDDAHVYWTEQDVDSAGRLVGAIVETPIKGGPVTRVQTLDADQVPHGLLAFGAWYDIDGEISSVEKLFWTMSNPHLGDASAPEIAACPLPAPFGPPARITDPDAGGATALAFDWSAPGILYSGPGAIHAVAVGVDGGLGAPRPLVATGGFVDRIIEDDRLDLYFIDPVTRRLMAAPLASADAQAPRTVVSSLDPATAFDVDGTCVYWVDARTETITMVTK